MFFLLVLRFVKLIRNLIYSSSISRRSFYNTLSRPKNYKILINCSPFLSPPLILINPPISFFRCHTIRENSRNLAIFILFSLFRRSGNSFLSPRMFLLLLLANSFFAFSSIEFLKRQEKLKIEKKKKKLGEKKLI